MPPIASHSTATSDRSWDGPANEARISNDAGAATLRRAYAWVDPEGDANTKAAYRFIHHEVAAGGAIGAANVTACRTGIGVLNGGRGGTTIPAADKRGVYDHLARHLRDAGVEPPAFRGENTGGNAMTPAPEDLGDMEVMGLEVMFELQTAGRLFALYEPVMDQLVAIANSGRPLGVRAARQVAAAKMSPDVTVNDKGVAVIPLKGLIVPETNLIARAFGCGGGLQGFREDMQAAIDDREVKSIVIDVDSPGGLVDMVPETADFVMKARSAGKPIVAVAQTMAASAAYWIAASAHELVAPTSGMVGSIGVFRTHRDLSRAADTAGIRMTYVSAGKFKVEGNQFEPLSSDAREFFQEQVDSIYSMFVKGVADGRATDPENVQDSYGQGRVFYANDARRRGMVDRVATLEATVSRLGSSNARVKQHADTGAFSIEYGDAPAALPAPEPAVGWTREQQRSALDLMLLR